MKQNTDTFKRMTVKEFLEAINNLDETIYEIRITNRFVYILWKDIIQSFGNAMSNLIGYCYGNE